MSDRELLKLAAKAAGAKMTDYSDRTPDHWIIQGADGVWRAWAPLDDDGDAFRLAVKMGLTRLIVLRMGPGGVVVDTIQGVAGPIVESATRREPFDQFAAARRVIVHAVAKIGMVMP